MEERLEMGGEEVRGENGVVWGSQMPPWVRMGVILKGSVL